MQYHVRTCNTVYSQHGSVHSLGMPRPVHIYQCTGNPNVLADTWCRAAPKPNRVEYKPAAAPETVNASNQAEVEKPIQTSIQVDDSVEDTMQFVEAVAARFSGARSRRRTPFFLTPHTSSYTSHDLVHGFRSAPVFGRIGVTTTISGGIVGVTVHVARSQTRYFDTDSSLCA